MSPVNSDAFDINEQVLGMMAGPVRVFNSIDTCTNDDGSRRSSLRSACTAPTTLRRPSTSSRRPDYHHTSSS
ncbi:hypothetical protein L596_030059 [Steinernema carpocapsae]|uniref:Uncharacterized protein n=1 Tax=Steinernema carpocapsae TaxID=34508 RepID=A0A4U5LRL9_STECR|nr:hypothetical protein L596_030059 [Steinernema carpocapsae]